MWIIEYEFLPVVVIPCLRSSTTVCPRHLSWAFLCMCFLIVFSPALRAGCLNLVLVRMNFIISCQLVMIFCVISSPCMRTGVWVTGKFLLMASLVVIDAKFAMRRLSYGAFFLMTTVVDGVNLKTKASNGRGLCPLDNNIILKCWTVAYDQYVIFLTLF